MKTSNHMYLVPVEDWELIQEQLKNTISPKEQQELYELRALYFSKQEKLSNLEFIKYIAEMPKDEVAKIFNKKPLSAVTTTDDSKIRYILTTNKTVRTTVSSYRTAMDEMTKLKLTYGNYKLDYVKEQQEREAKLKNKYKRYIIYLLVAWLVSLRVLLYVV